MKIEERLAKNATRAGGESHIVPRQEICRTCATRPCLRVCPGHLYSLVEETGEIRVEHSGCLECGTCLLACPLDGLDWRYPSGGVGIRYRFG